MRTACMHARHSPTDTARSRSRQRAVEILFEAEQRGATVAEGIRTRRESTDLQVNAYTQRLVAAVPSVRRALAGVTAADLAAGRPA